MRGEDSDLRGCMRIVFSFYGANFLFLFVGFNFILLCACDSLPLDMRIFIRFVVAGLDFSRSLVESVVGLVPQLRFDHHRWKPGQAPALIFFSP
jgi:hypothetical protein